MTLPQVKAAFVDAFPGNATRERLYRSLEEYIQRLLVADICCEIWLDGSFLTEKQHPDDIDVAMVLDADVAEALSPEQKDLVDSANDAGTWQYVDSFAFVKRDRSDPLFGNDLADPASGWHEVYGLEHGKRWLKGFVVLRLRETHVGLRICS